MLNKVSLGNTDRQFNLSKNRKKTPQNIAFKGNELGKFIKDSAKDVSVNAAKSIYRASVKLAVKGYDATKSAIQNFDKEKAMTSAKKITSDFVESAPTKFKSFKEKIKALTNEAVEDVRKKK